MSEGYDVYCGLLRVYDGFSPTPDDSTPQFEYDLRRRYSPGSKNVANLPHAWTGRLRHQRTRLHNNGLRSAPPTAV